MDFAKKSRRTMLVCGLLSAVTLATFWPVTRHDFVNYDDDRYVTANAHVKQGLTWGTLAWSFQARDAVYWHPVTWVSHLLDVRLFGLNAGRHHLVSLLFHTANTVLLFLLLQHLTGAAWRSAFVAALFALHPLHVQSVAWVAERKDVLSAFCFFLTLLAYARYAEQSKVLSLKSKVQGPDAGVQSPGADVSRITYHVSRFTHHASRYYLLALLFFALGLMSKPMLITLPFVLLLLDYWPLQRCQSASRSLKPPARKFHPSSFILHPLLLEKLPFFALSAGLFVATFVANSQHRAVRAFKVLPFMVRLDNAIVAGAAYLGKMFWPVHLSVFYPLRLDLPAGTVLGAAVVLIGLTAWAVYGWRHRPYLAVGWFWFFGMLIPVLGLVQVGGHQMADRYTYLPLIGIFLMLTWEIVERVAARASLSALSPGAVASMGDLRPSGQPSAQMPAFPVKVRTVLALVAGAVLAFCALETRHQLGYWRDSLTLFGRALELDSGNEIALNNYCLELFSQGKYEEAAGRLSDALRAKPKLVPALVQLGIARSMQGRTNEAMRAFSAAVQEAPDYASARGNFGYFLSQQGWNVEAVRELQAAVRLQPDYPGGFAMLANACQRLGRTAEAIAYYREAIRLQPDNLALLNNFAWLLAASPDARLRNGQEAMLRAVRACELTKYQHPLALTTLAAACAEAGRFQEAIGYAEQAQALLSPRQRTLAARLAAMLEAFHADRAYHVE